MTCPIPVPDATGHAGEAPAGPTVYLAGPMTGYPEFNYPAFHEGAARLRALGFRVLNPAENFGGDQTRDYREYMRADAAMILSADGIALLPGWERSKGARFELHLAQLLGLSVFDATTGAPLEAPQVVTADPAPPPSPAAPPPGLYPTRDPARPEDVATAGVKFDAGKPRLDLLPARPLLDIARVLTFGAAKYDDHNWRRGMRWGRVYASLVRHLLAWHAGEDNDPETGLPHLAHAGCCVLFLLEYAHANPELDDRYRAPEAPAA